jgi:hypothetical protein
VSRLTRTPWQVYATARVLPRWQVSLPTAVLALFLLGFPCRSLMLNAQGPAHDCCGDTSGQTQESSTGCQTLCSAAAGRILVQTLDVSVVPAPADLGPAAVLASLTGAFHSSLAATVAYSPPGLRPLYLQHSSLLI